MKRTLKRELKSAWNCWEGSEWKLRVRPGWMWNGTRPGPPLNAGRWSAWAVAAGQTGEFLTPRFSLRRLCRCDGRGTKRASILVGLVPTARSGRWRIELFIRPVLKHGPRSLTCMRAGGRQTHWGASKLTGGSSSRRSAPSTDRDLLWKVWVWAHMLGPERWWTMPEQGEARGNSGGGS